MLYRGWVKKQKRSMRQLHMAGVKLFLNYCGPTVPVVNPDTGVIRHAQIFVATLGASNDTYIEASPAQDHESWLMAHARAFEFFGGVPQLLVPDNLRAAVKKADRYDPVLMRTIRSLRDTTTPPCCPPGPTTRKTKRK